MSIDPSHRYNRKTVPAGTVIIQQGTTGTAAYIIESGQVEITITRPDGTDVRLSTRNAGAIVGEMAMVDNQRRTANVKALTPCTLLEISRAEFERRLESADPVLGMVMQVVLTRYRALLNDSDTEAVLAEQATRDNTRAIETLRLTNEFKEAIFGGQLRLFYQPIIDVAQNRVAGFEALMRWQHPERGMISPAQFIPVAEESGLIIHATKWAISEAAAMMARMEGKLPDMGDKWFMSLNFTGHDLSDPRFAGDISAILNIAQIDPRRIKMEITESLLIDDPEETRKTLHACRAAGFTVALDDFGTGYSSLAYLHRFPIDTMKIDRSFVREMTSKPSSLTLVRGIVALAKGMGMTLVAEGAEKAEEVDILRAMGCEMIQGFVFARPMPEDTVSQWLESRAY